MIELWKRMKEIWESIRYTFTLGAQPDHAEILHVYANICDAYARKIFLQKIAISLSYGYFYDLLKYLKIDLQPN